MLKYAVEKKTLFMNKRYHQFAACVYRGIPLGTFAIFQSRYNYSRILKTFKDTMKKDFLSTII